MNLSYIRRTERIEKLVFSKYFIKCVNSKYLLKKQIIHKILILEEFFITFMKFDY